MKPTRTISMVNIEAAGGIDPARLRRALTLTARRIDRGRYEVSGGRAVHYVDLIDPMMERCDCADFTWRQVVCQHLLACLLREGDERVVAAVGVLVSALRGENASLRAELRGRTIPLTCTVRARVAEATLIHADELEFRRDRRGRTADVRVHHRLSGDLVGTLTRSLGKPQFIPSGAGAAPGKLRIAA